MAATDGSPTPARQEAQVNQLAAFRLRMSLG